MLYGTNSSTVIEAVEAKLVEIGKALPEGVEIDPYYEQKTLVQSSLNTVTSALLAGHRPGRAYSAGLHPALHAARRRGQDVSPARLHCLAGHVWLADQCPDRCAGRRGNFHAPAEK